MGFDCASDFRKGRPRVNNKIDFIQPPGWGVLFSFWTNFQSSSFHLSLSHSPKESLHVLLPIRWATFSCHRCVGVHLVCVCVCVCVCVRACARVSVCVFIVHLCSPRPVPHQPRTPPFWFSSVRPLSGACDSACPTDVPWDAFWKRGVQYY